MILRLFKFAPFGDGKPRRAGRWRKAIRLGVPCMTSHLLSTIHYLLSTPTTACLPPLTEPDESPIISLHSALRADDSNP